MLSIFVVTLGLVEYFSTSILCMCRSKTARYADLYLDGITYGLSHSRRESWTKQLINDKQGQAMAKQQSNDLASGPYL